MIRTFTPGRRATAMAIFGTGVNWGILSALGGWLVNGSLVALPSSWVGLPGCPGPLVAYRAEPPRGGNAASPSPAPRRRLRRPSLKEVVRWRATRSCATSFLPASIAFAGYAAIIWVPVYLVRIHGLGTGIVGTYPHIVGFGGAAGILLADGWPIAPAQRGPQWLLDRRLATLSALLLWTFGPHGAGALLGFAVPAMLATVRGPSFAPIQNEVLIPCGRGRNKSFITNIIGLGLGSFSVGFFSDVFASSCREESLRYRTVW